MSRLSSSRVHGKKAPSLGRAVVAFESNVQVFPSTRTSLIREHGGGGGGEDTSDFVKRTVERYRKAVADIESKRVLSIARNSGTVTATMDPKPAGLLTTSNSEGDSTAVALKKKKKKKKSKKKKKRKDVLSATTTTTTTTPATATATLSASFSSSSKPRKSSSESHRSSSSKSRRNSSSSKGSSGSSGSSSSSSSRPRKSKREAKAVMVSGLTSALDAAVAGFSALGPADFAIGAGHENDVDSAPSFTRDKTVATSTAISPTDMLKKDGKQKRKKKEKKRTSTTSLEREDDEATPIETVPILHKSTTVAAKYVSDVVLQKEKKKEKEKRDSTATANTKTSTTTIKKKKKRNSATSDTATSTTTTAVQKKEKESSVITASPTIATTTIASNVKEKQKKKKQKEKSLHRRSSSSSSSSSTTSRTSSLESAEATTVSAATIAATEDESLSNEWDDPMLDQGFDLTLISPGFPAPKPILASTSLGSKPIDPNRKLSIIELRELRTSAVLNEVRCYWNEWWMWYDEIYATNQEQDGVDVPMSVCAMTTPNTALLELDDDLNPTHPIHSSNIKKDSITQLRERIEEMAEEESEEELSIFDMHMMGANSMSSMSSFLGNSRGKIKPGIFGIDSHELELSPRTSVVSDVVKAKKTGTSMSSAGGESSKSTSSVLASTGCHGRNKSVHWPEMNRLFEFASEDEDFGYYEYEEGEAVEGEQENNENQVLVYSGHAALIEDDDDEDYNSGDIDQDGSDFQQQSDQEDFSTRYLMGAVRSSSEKDDYDENSSIVWDGDEDEEDTLSSEGGSAHFMDLGGVVGTGSDEVDDDEYPDLEPWGTRFDDTVAAVGNRVSFDELMARDGTKIKRVRSASKIKSVVQKVEADADDFVNKLMTMANKKNKKKNKNKKNDAKDEKDGEVVRSWAAAKNANPRSRNMYGSITSNASFVRAVKEQQGNRETALTSEKKKLESKNPMAPMPMPMPMGSNDMLERARRTRQVERKRSKNSRRTDSFAEAVTNMQDQPSTKNQRPNLHKAKMSVKRVLRRVTSRVGLVRPERSSLVEM